MSIGLFTGFALMLSQSFSFLGADIKINGPVYMGTIVSRQGPTSIYGDLKYCNELRVCLGAGISNWHDRPAALSSPVNAHIVAETGEVYNFRIRFEHFSDGSGSGQGLNLLSIRRNF